MAEIENKEELLKVFAQSQTGKAITQWISSSEFSMIDKDGIVTRVLEWEIRKERFSLL